MKKFIIFQFRNKKLLLPFGMAFAQIILNIINSTKLEPKKNQILELIITTATRLSLIFIPIFTKSLFEKRKNSHFLTGWKKKSYLHFLIQGFIYGVYIGLFLEITFLTTNQTSGGSVQNPHNSGLSTVEGLEFISIFVFSALILKYKYFFNHIISVIFFLIICVVMDIITDNFTFAIDTGKLYIILTVIQKLVDGISYVFQKYMMDILYHPFWSVGVCLGVVNFLYFATLLFVALGMGKENAIESNNKLFIDFFEYFEKVSVWRIIVKQLLNYILNFIINLLRYLTIYYLTPEYILISFTISRIFNIVIKTKKYECLALFAFQFICLLLYLEIIELNFCGLNKNTRRNISERSASEFSDIDRISEASDIELDKDYEFNETLFNEQKDNRNSKPVIEMKETYDMASL